MRALLARPDFRRLYVAVLVSELGDAMHYIAVMWFALILGGPRGVIVVRLADSVPALFFGLLGGLVADRRDPRRVMIAADLVRAAVLVPVALLAMRGSLPIAALAGAAALLVTATSYFAPAYGVLLPAIVSSDELQAANAILRGSANAVSIGGWALSAVLAAVVPMGTFFAINAASFVLSAIALSRLATPVRRAASEEPLKVREAFAALRPHPALTMAIVVYGIAETVSSGAWIGGVPDLVRLTLGRGAGTFSWLMVAFALGAVIAGVGLARVQVRDKTRGAILSWVAALPAYLLFAHARSVVAAGVAAALVGSAQAACVVLLQSAAQERVKTEALGRVTGWIAMVDRGSHALGLIVVAPWFAIVQPPRVFAWAAVGTAVVALGGWAISSARVAER